MAQTTEAGEWMRTGADRARALGALEARIIATASIVTASWVRLRCQFGCDRYATNRCCPPHTPTAAEMREVLQAYSGAILFRCSSLKEPTPVAMKLEREAFLAGYYKALGLGAGRCRLCKTCDLEHPCQHPEEARPSLESCGIDVYATVRANGMPIDVLTEEGEQGNYYGVVLVE